MKHALHLVLLAALGSAAPAIAADIQPVHPVLETPNLGEADGTADADDPSFWLNPADPSRTLVITAVKNGGMRVYDLEGKQVQVIKPAKTDAGKGRINNVDVVYGAKLADGSIVDLAVASDRGLDVIRVFRIDGAAAEPLTEITDLSIGRAFPKRPDPAGAADLDNPLDDQMTVYGLAAWKATDGTVRVVGTQRTNPRVGLFELKPVEGGKMAVIKTAEASVPFTFRGQTLTTENEEDAELDWNPQFEGVVVDKVSGTVYAGQEDVGIWRLDSASARFDAEPVYTTRGSTKSPFNAPDSVVARDVEGLTVYYGASQRYLLVSSQGGAHGDGAVVKTPVDDSFAVFRIDDGFTLIGSFQVVASGAFDSVQESDGADVIATGLPGFPNGLFVTQDGYNDDLDGLNGKTAATNFKYVDWAAIAGSFTPKLEVNTAYDPRR